MFHPGIIYTMTAPGERSHRFVGGSKRDSRRSRYLATELEVYNEFKKEFTTSTRDLRHQYGDIKSKPYGPSGRHSWYLSIRKKIGSALCSGFWSFKINAKKRCRQAN